MIDSSKRKRFTDMMTDSGNSTYNSYNPDRGRRSFETASLTFGIISIVLLCTGVLAIPAGALGILFALLSRKGKNPFTGTAIAGLILSCFGMIFGSVITVIAVYSVLTDPTVLDQVREMYARYGMEMPEYPFTTTKGGGL